MPFPEPFILRFLEPCKRIGIGRNSRGQALYGRRHRHWRNYVWDRILRLNWRGITCRLQSSNESCYIGVTVGALFSQGFEDGLSYVCG